ncbi:hypothetical protein G6H54_000774 [Listeria monocytogenes]|nr:hypothetical protein [Listeria monocytogenes]EEO9088086.1 hypothetical protein [Listeria monocytogenes]
MKAINRIVEKCHIFIAFVPTVILALLTYIQVIKNVDSIVSDLISVMAVVIGVYGIYIGVVISLQESNLFKRIRDELKINIEEKIFTKLRNQMLIAVLTIIYSLGVKIFPKTGNLVFDTIGLSIWYYLISIVFINIFWIVIFFTNVSKKQNQTVTKRKTSS